MQSCHDGGIFKIVLIWLSGPLSRFLFHIHMWFHLLVLNPPSFFSGEDHNSFKYLSLLLFMLLLLCVFCGAVRVRPSPWRQARRLLGVFNSLRTHGPSSAKLICRQCLIAASQLTFTSTACQ